MNAKRHIYLIVLCLLTAACSDKEVGFTYSPEEPRAGQTISFTNSTSEGEKWEWTFGDGTSSSSKSPSKVYKRAGTYSVILTVDGKKSRRCAQTVVVSDTVPTIELSEDSVARFMTPVALRMSAYNPYSYKVTYQWTLGDSVILHDGELTDQEVTVLFREHDCGVTVRCHLTVGDNEYDCAQTFAVEDTIAPSLLFSPAQGRLSLQRLFTYGAERPLTFRVAVGSLTTDEYIETAPVAGVVHGDQLYLFMSDHIEAIDLAAHTRADVLQAPASAGTCHDGMLYWASGTDGLIYRTAEQTRSGIFTQGSASPMLWANLTTLGYGLTAGQTVTDLAWYNDVCLVAYGKGIYRFREADIHSGITPDAGAILTDVTVLHFAVDAIAKKIYYLADGGLYVCNMSGTQPRLLSSNADGQALCVDNVFSRIYWSATDGIYYLPLVQAANNATTDVPALLNAMPTRFLTMDPTQRYCFEHKD